MNQNYIKIKEDDNVAVVIKATETIPTGHKIALNDINKGENIIKYGFPIGHATEDIKKGQLVHVHNMKTNLSDIEEYSYQPISYKMPEDEMKEIEFSAFHRSDGSIGIRNEIWIIPTVGCVNDVAKKLAESCQDLVDGSLEGIYSFAHPWGCSQIGDDHRHTRKILCGLAKHPNAAAVLIVGLGCENLTHDQIIEELGNFSEDRIKFLICQEVEDELKEGRKLLEECSYYAKSFKRKKASINQLVVGLKCGGSDGFSGITANPAVGRCSDLLVSAGASTLLTEVPEMFGAEKMLFCRCINEKVFIKSKNMLNEFKNYYLSQGEVIYENPSPGNKEGGISTLEDKSCGCVQKGGNALISDVIAYGEQIKSRGLNLLCGPGNDLVSSTALTVAGAHLILFTTGRGTPFGAPIPTIKISTNTKIYKKKSNWIDFNAGLVIEGEALEETAKRLVEHIVKVANGENTKTEKNGFRDISIWKKGVVL